jgi:hypothetical protein
MSYSGNLTCGDCGFTFIETWGSHRRADEYRCENDHVLFVDTETKTVLTVDGCGAIPVTLLDLRGLCPTCETELATGLMPCCPVCGGRDHEALLSAFGPS